MKKTITFDLGLSLAEVEKQYLVKTLQACEGSRRFTAEVLGVSVRTIERKLIEYQLDGWPLPPRSDMRFDRKKAFDIAEAVQPKVTVKGKPGAPKPPDPEEDP